MKDQLVFIDTNILLHYKWLEDCEFKDLSESRFIVVPQLIRELEKRQYGDPSKKLRERAQTILRRLAGLFDAGPLVKLRNGITLEAFGTAPVIDFAVHTLTRDVADDYFLAHMIQASEETGGMPVVLYSADGPLAFKAKMRGFPVLRPKDDWLIASQLSEEERELNELRSQAAARPKLSLTLVSNRGKSSFITYRVKRLRQWTPQEMASLRNQVISKLPTFLPHDFSPWTVERLKENEQLMKEYSDYIEDLHDFRNTVHLEIPLAVWNEGGARGEDLHVRIEFETDAALAEEQPQPPEQPEEQESYLGWNPKVLKSIVPVPIQMERVAGLRPYLSKIAISAGGWPVAEMVLGRAPQQSASALVPLYRTFRDTADVKGFRLKYEIRAANVPNTIRGAIDVRMEVEESDEFLPEVHNPTPGD